VSAADPRARSRVCASCGALNGADFNRCIRCGTALSPAAASADLLRSHIDGRSLLATKGLIGLTLAVFAFQMLVELSQHTPISDLVTKASANVTLRFGSMALNFPFLPGLDREPWRLLSAVFVHYGMLHVGLNMLALANLGRVAEPIVGSSRFVVAYVAAGIAGFGTSALYAISNGQSYSTAGASGAVLGVMGIIVGWLVRRRDPRWKQFAVQALFYGFVFGFMVNASNVGLLVNNSAHMGGLLCGVLFGAIYAGRRSRSDLWANIAAVFALLACVASLVLSQMSPAWRTLQRLIEQSS